MDFLNSIIQYLKELLNIQKFQFIFYFKKNKKTVIMKKKFYKKNYLLLPFLELSIAGLDTL